MKTTQTGIRCEIFQWSLPNCSAGGISSKLNTVTLLHAGGPFAPSDDAPAVQLVRRTICGQEYVHAEPVTPCPDGACRMAGGTFIYSSDSRFSEVVDNGGYPVSLHDRHEFSSANVD